MLGCISVYIYFTSVKLRNSVYAIFLNLFRLISINFGKYSELALLHCRCARPIEAK